MKFYALQIYAGNMEKPINYEKYFLDRKRAEAEEQRLKAALIIVRLNYSYQVYVIEKEMEDV